MSEATVRAWPCLEAEGPVLVFGGAHGNLHATRALLAEAERLEVPPSHIVCTGGLVGWGADPAACVGLVREAGIHVVAGASEAGLAGLDDEAHSWMRGRPGRMELRLAGRRLAVVHGSVTHADQRVFASDAGEIGRQIELSGDDGVIGGRCGLPFTRIDAGGLWHNAGAVGMPANDGTPRGWFSLLLPGSSGIGIRHLPLAYDHAGAAARIRTAGRSEAYAAALEAGLWPDSEALPAPERARRGQPLVPGRLAWTGGAACELPAAWPRGRFSDPDLTASGERRAVVPFAGLRTLWFNTGTLCNITCAGCYIESSPRNDRLAYLSRAEVRVALDEAAAHHPDLREIGFTGGEPFMNRDLPGMLEDALAAGYRVLVLTNAMRPMQRVRAALLDLQRRFADGLALRVSLDHHEPRRHEALRGPRTWQPALAGLRWLAENGFDVSVAGRTPWGESEAELRAGYGRLFAGLNLDLDPSDPARLVLFPEMNARAEVPEITESCWGILGRSPHEVMCSSARMVAKRRGASGPVVLSCTLLPYDAAFELGTTLAEAAQPVKLNHRLCAEFCVLGGASCSAPP